MEFIRSKIQKVQNRVQLKTLLDSRLWMLVGVSFIALSIFWNGAKIIQQNYQLQQKVEQIEQENEVLVLENQNKALQNEYFKTDEFADITARRVFGRASAGERVYIVSESVAKNALTTTTAEDQPVQIVSEKPQWQQNVEAWLGIYFGG
jgi:cell division protein FtsB